MPQTSNGSPGAERFPQTFQKPKKTKKVSALDAAAPGSPGPTRRLLHQGTVREKRLGQKHGFVPFLEMWKRLILEMTPALGPRSHALSSTDAAVLELAGGSGCLLAVGRRIPAINE
jgi:hypothetical protein